MSATTMPRTATAILVIEDEPSVSAFVKAALERRGYKVVQASSGAAGLQQLEERTFAGVISDIRMPGNINGADVHEWIRKNRPQMASKIILISGDTANSETQQLLASSPTPCLEKPFRVQKLISMVEKTFGKP
jgi:CheY-like chemotaxis protein